MVYGDLICYELQYIVWQRMVNFLKSIDKRKRYFFNMIYAAFVENNLDNEKKSKTMVKIVVSSRIRNSILRQDFEFQSWHEMIRTSTLCESFSSFKHHLKLEIFLECLQLRKRTQLSTFSCPLTI